MFEISIQIFQFSEVWFEDGDDNTFPRYTLVKTSKDNSLETLVESKKHRCPCLANADREPPNYKSFHAWTSQILDLSFTKMAHTSESCMDECMNEIIQDIMCTDTKGMSPKYFKK